MRKFIAVLFMLLMVNIPVTQAQISSTDISIGGLIIGNNKAIVERYWGKPTKSNMGIEYHSTYYYGDSVVITFDYRGLSYIRVSENNGWKTHKGLKVRQNIS